MVAHPYAHTAYWPSLGTAGGDIEGEKGAAFRTEIHVNSALVLSQRCLVRVCLPTKPPCRLFMTPKSSGSVRCLGDVHSMSKERCVSCVRGTSYFLRVGLGAEGQG